MSVHKSAPQTPPKDLELDEIFKEYDLGHEQCPQECSQKEYFNELKTQLIAWSDKRTLAIIGDDDLETHRPQPTTPLFERNALREQQRKALKADKDGGDERL